MDLAAFERALADEEPPPGLGEALRALWYEANDAWETAHQCVQDQADADGAWVHAYLHRVEGDRSNARHWYRLAGRKPSDSPLADEWREIAAALLAKPGTPEP